MTHVYLSTPRSLRAVVVGLIAAAMLLGVSAVGAEASGLRLVDVVREFLGVEVPQAISVDAKANRTLEPPIFAGSVNLAAAGVPYTQSFDTLTIIASSTLPEGWWLSETGTNANTTYSASNGSGSTGDTYSYGTTAASDRAFGTLQSSSLIPTIGASFTNGTGNSITSVAISFTGEEWRLGTAGRADRLDFQYSTDASSLTTGTWTDVNALDLTTPNSASAIGSQDGNAAANRTAVAGSITGLSIANGGAFWIRWNDLDATSADDGLAIDDFSLTATTAATPTPTATATATPTATPTATATATPTATPTSTPTPTPTPSPTPSPQMSYTITASAGAHGLVSPAGVTSVSSGGSLVVFITPDPGYHIDTIMVDGGPVMPATSPYTFSDVTSNHTITATFAETAGCETIAISTGLSSITGVGTVIPVDTSDLTGDDVIAAEFKLTYDPAVLSDAGIADADLVTAGTVVQSGTVIDINRPSSGVILVALSGATPFAGVGTLVDIHLNVIGTAASTTGMTALTLSSIDPMYPNIFYNGGYVCAAVTSGALTVSPNSTTTTVSSTPSPSVYGDPVTFTATVSPNPAGGTVQFEIDGSTVGIPPAAVDAATGTAAYTTSAFSAGTHPIVAHYSGFAAYAGSDSLAYDQVVNKAILNINAAAGTKVYGAGDPMFTYTLSGFRFSDTAAVVSGMASCSRVPGENVGAYAITCSAGSLTASNYTFATGSSADLTITVRSAEWTTNPASKLFGTADPVPLTTGSGSGFLTADNVTAVYSRVPGEAAGIYHITALLSASGDLNNYLITNAGADFTIVPRVLSGTVTYENAASGTVYIPRTTIAASAGSPTVPSALSGSDGSFTMTGFGLSSYTITPGKPAYPTAQNTAIAANDASMISRHVVQITLLNTAQQKAAKVGGGATITAFDASLVAQYIVGIPNALSQAGTWKFTPASSSLVVDAASVRSFGGTLMGDVSGDWVPDGSNRPVRYGMPTKQAVIASVPRMTAALGSEVLVPFSIDNLANKVVDAYQFDITYDPSVITPAQIAASVTGTLSANLSVVSHSPEPGLLKVAVYGAIPASGDGVYVNLRFMVTGGIGSMSPLTITDFRFNDGRDEIITVDGRIVVGHEVDVIAE